MDTDFRLHCALDAFEKAGDPNPMRIGGIVSTDKLDKQGETIVQGGLDFSPFLAEGWFNDNHGQRSIDVVGYPTDAKFVAKGEMLPNGKPAASAGWWAEGYLLDTDEGRKLWGLAQSLAKSPRKLGFSIEGKVSARDPKKPERIMRAAVRNVAVTHCPVAYGTELHALVKAMTAGSDIVNPGASPGTGFALRGESLDDGAAAQVADAELPGDIDEIDVVHEWAPWLAQGVAQEPPKALTKAEARIIVRAVRPHLSDRQVDQLIQTAH